MRRGRPFLIIAIFTIIFSTLAPEEGNTNRCNTILDRTIRGLAQTRGLTTRPPEAIRPHDLPTQALEGLAQPYASYHDIPGRPGSIFHLGGIGRYVRTMVITSAHLPYPSHIRPTYVHVPRLPSRLEDFPTAGIQRTTDIILASDIVSGSSGLVRLAETSTGVPVVLKTYTEGYSRDQILLEAQSAQLISDLGIGPRFHGIYVDPRGRWNIVMDIVPGDLLRPGSVTLQTFSDLETILLRLQGAGVRSLPADFQVYVTQEGRVMVIDPDRLASQMNLAAPIDRRFVEERLTFLQLADESIGLQYLESLRLGNPSAWDEMRQAILANPGWSQRYIRYFRFD